MPSYLQHANDIISWKLSDGTSEWGYPNSLDMTLYRRRQALNEFSHMVYSTPNTLEEAWHSYGIRHGHLHNQALCYTHSKLVNVPLNLVQLDWQTSFNMGYDLRELLELFNQGYRITIESYYKFNNAAPHAEIRPHVIKQIHDITCKFCA